MLTLLCAFPITQPTIPQMVAIFDSKDDAINYVKLSAMGVHGFMPESLLHNFHYQPEPTFAFLRHCHDLDSVDDSICNSHGPNPFLYGCREPVALRLITRGLSHNPVLGQYTKKIFDTVEDEAFDD